MFRPGNIIQHSKTPEAGDSRVILKREKESEQREVLRKRENGEGDRVWVERGVAEGGKIGAPGVHAGGEEISDGAVSGEDRRSSGCVCSGVGVCEEAQRDNDPETRFT